MKITERVETLVQPVVHALGFELYDVEYAKEAGSMVLTLYIDAPGGVSIDDCERVSRAVDPILDEVDPIMEAYFLSVSSVGLDRPIKKDKDFARNLGTRVTVKLYAPLHGKKEFTGRLSSYDAESFTLAVDEGESLLIRRKDAAKVQPYIDFSNLLKEK